MIRIFIGCAGNHEDVESQQVLEHTIRKFSSEPVDITWMKLSMDPGDPCYANWKGDKGWRTERWPTPFSAFRWAIPEWCDFKGKAIYMDSDVIVRADIAEMWHQPFGPGKVALAKGDPAWRFCVCMWDCERMEAHSLSLAKLKSDIYSHRRMQQYFSRNPNIVQAFEGNWNCLDGEDYQDLADPDIKAIHYTSMRHQPQTRHAVPRLAAEGRTHWFDGEPALHWRSDLIEMFDAELAEANAAGLTVETYTADPLYGPYKKLNVGGQGKVMPPWGKKFAA